jgi:hypothetical protein
MNDRITHKYLSFLLLIASFFTIGNLSAGQEEFSDGKDYSKEVAPAPTPWCETPPPFEISISVPGWFSGISGDVGVKGVVSSVDIPFYTLFDHLTHVPISLSVDVRYKRWELFGSGEYVEVGASATLPGLLFTNANAHLKVGGLGTFLGYRVINCDKAYLSLFAGMRYTYLEGDLSIVDNGDARLVRLRELLGIPKRLDFSNSTGWVDPVIGARGRVRIWKAMSLYAEGDVGGFNANSGSAFEIDREGRTVARNSIDSSDWSYQVQGGLEIQLTRSMWSQVGWRYLKYDYKQEGFNNNLALNGPIVQCGVNF